MNDLGVYLTTRTGFRLHVRPAQPAEAPTVADFFTHATRDDLRHRFLADIDIVGFDRIAAIVSVDHRQTESFLAFTADGSMVASGMSACDPARQHGEVAISIRYDFKDNSVRWELLSYIAREAEATGLQTLESIESQKIAPQSRWSATWGSRSSRIREMPRSCASAAIFSGPRLRRIHATQP